MKILQFQPNKVLDLYLELVYDKYAEILSHLADMDDQTVRLFIYGFFIFVEPAIDVVA